MSFPESIPPLPSSTSVKRHPLPTCILTSVQEPQRSQCCCPGPPADHNPSMSQTRSGIYKVILPSMCISVHEDAPTESLTPFPLFALLSRSSSALPFGLPRWQMSASARDPMRKCGSEVQCPSDVYLLGKEPHHHANVCLVLLIHRIVQDNIHELVKAAQHASDVPVGIQGHCRKRHPIKSEPWNTSDTTV